MSFTLDENVIRAIVDSTFPTNNEFDINNVFVRNSGTDTILDVKFYIDDIIPQSFTQQKFKVFNNIEAKKFLKLKIFEISSSKMANEIEACQTPKEIENTITKYSSYFENVSPTSDFIGDKTNYNDHVIYDSPVVRANPLTNRKIRLSFIKRIVLARENVKYFSLGMMFYYDYEEYVREKAIDETFIQKEILWRKPKIIELFSDLSTPIKNYISDLRIYSKTQETINNLKDATRNIENVYESLDVDTKTINFLSDNKPNISLNNYLSNIHFSRNINGNLSFFFTLDYHSIIRNNFAYKNTILKSDVEDFFLDQVSIASMSIIRRQVKKTNYSGVPKLQIIDDTYKKICFSVDVDKKLLFFSDRNSSLKETSINAAGRQNNYLRFFEGTDKQVYQQKSGLYQYGVEIVLRDSVKKYLLDHLKECRNDIKNLQNYLEDTTKTVITRKTVFDVSDLTSRFISSERKGFYDEKLRSFTSDYIIQEFTPKHCNNVDNATIRLSLLHKMLGFTKKEFENAKLTQYFKSLTNPITCNAESILLFLNVYKKFILQFEKIIKTLSSKDIVLEYWFNNDLVDASQRIDIGYKFIDNEEAEGLGTVTVNQILSLVDENLGKYTPENRVEVSSEESVFSYIGPKSVISPNSSIDFNKLISNPDLVTELNFYDTETDIKRNNGLNVVNLTNNTINDVSSLNLKNTNLLGEFSVSIDNLFANRDSFYTSAQNRFATNRETTNISQLSLNENINPTSLMMMLLKNYSVDKKRFNKNNKATHITTADLEKISEDFKRSFPYQILHLAEGRSKFFANETEYLTYTPINSIFLFLYATIHSIEYITYNTDVIRDNTGFLKELPNLKRENWRLLNSNTVRNLEQNRLLLCRLNLFNSLIFGSNNYEQIKLPIYNKYFLLGNVGGSFSFERQKFKTFEGLFDALKKPLRESFKDEYIKSITPPVPPPPPPQPSPAIGGTVVGIYPPSMTTTYTPPAQDEKPNVTREDVGIVRLETNIPIIENILDNLNLGGLQKLNRPSTQAMGIDYDRYIKDASICLEQQQTLADNCKKIFVDIYAKYSSSTDKNIQDAYINVEQIYNNIVDIYKRSKKQYDELMKLIKNDSTNEDELKQLLNKICSSVEETNELYENFNRYVQKFNDTFKKIRSDYEAKIAKEQADNIRKQQEEADRKAKKEKEEQEKADAAALDLLLKQQKEAADRAAKEETGRKAEEERIRKEREQREADERREEDRRKLKNDLNNAISQCFNHLNSASADIHTAKGYRDQIIKDSAGIVNTTLSRKTSDINKNIDKMDESYKSMGNAYANLEINLEKDVLERETNQRLTSNCSSEMENIKTTLTIITTLKNECGQLIAQIKQQQASATSSSTSAANAAAAAAGSVGQSVGQSAGQATNATTAPAGGSTGSGTGIGFGSGLSGQAGRVVQQSPGVPGFARTSR